MSITIMKAGIMDSLQDEGRYGFASLGINPGGVMDRFAAASANFLVGNPKDTAVIELHFPAMQALFRQDALIAICGADFMPTCHDEELPSWQPVMVKRNALLHFQKWRWGARAYLAVHGGFDEAMWLNSHSTNLKAGAGGHAGRALAKDDVLRLRKSQADICRALNGCDCRVLHWGVQDRNIYADQEQLKILPGPEWGLLDDASKKLLLNNVFTIAPNSDRMGYRMSGEALKSTHSTEMLSSGVNAGTIQLLPDGQLMILMADHQTTGGYPRVANVIGAHLPKLAQLPPSGEVRFELTGTIVIFTDARSEDH
jgi:antagonist of KipI